MIIAGIDPGLEGGVAIASVRKEVGGRFGRPRLISVFDIPVKKVDSGMLVDARRLYDKMGDFDIDIISMEWPGPRPVNVPGDKKRRSLKTEYRFALGNGATLAVCQMLTEKVVLTPPATWKGKLGVTSDKSTSIDLARRSVSEDDAAKFLSLSSKDGRAEAVLMIEYVMRLILEGKALVIC